MRTKELFEFIRERHAIWERRKAGQPKPWTSDPILQQFRFTNVYRELDTVTIWIRKNWREPHRDDPNIFFSMAVARLVNWPDSLAEIGYPIPWKPDKFVKVLDRRKTSKQKVFSNAYMIHADNHSSLSKAAYLAECVLTPLWKDRANAKQFTNSLSQFHFWLMSHRDLGSFMAGQIVADTKHTALLKDVFDWWDWAAPGPGSERGLNIVMDRPLNTRWKQGEWLLTLRELKKEIDPLIKKAKMSDLDAMNLQNCLCELSKHTRGYSKNRYPGESE